MKQKETFIIAYHAKCIDGFTAAWVAARALESEGKKYRLYPMSYKPEDETHLLDLITNHHSYTGLYVLDMSLTLDALVYIDEDVRGLRDFQVHIIDHHKTTVERYFPEHTDINTPIRGGLHGNFVTLDTTQCGAMLTWHHFRPHSKVPALLHYIQEYDLWQFKQGADGESNDAKYVHQVANIIPKNLKIWDNLAYEVTHRSTRQSVLASGKILYDTHMRECVRIALQAVVAYVSVGDDITDDSIRTGMLFTTDTKYINDVAELVNTVYPLAAIGYISSAKPEEVKWSLRSAHDSDIDVSAIAKQYGGGGHKHAAGFIGTEDTIRPYYRPGITAAARKETEPCK